MKKVRVNRINEPVNRINEPKILEVGTGVRNGPFTEVSLKVPDAAYKQSVNVRLGSTRDLAQSSAPLPVPCRGSLRFKGLPQAPGRTDPGHPPRCSTVIPVSTTLAAFSYGLTGLDRRSGQPSQRSGAVRTADPTASAIVVGSAVRTVAQWPER
jgi:hypothetical protein